MNEPSSTPEAVQALLFKRIQASFRDAVEAAGTARDRAARALNLHPTDFACLDYLQRAGEPVSPKQIIAHLNLSSGSGTALLDRLESSGYTRRLPNPQDRRSILIELDQETAKKPLLRLKEMEHSYTALIQSCSEPDLQAVARFMEEMSRFAKKLD